MLIQNLRCDIVGCSDLFAHFFFGVENLSSAEIDDFDLVKLLACFKQNVFWLQISVHNVVTVTVDDARKKLFH